MQYNESSKKATTKYIKEKRDRIGLNMPKGTKEIWQKQADKYSLSITAYITKLIENDIKKESNNV